MKNPVTERRCSRCGAIGHVPHEGGLCPACTKWKEKNK
jgi:NMD protein affecting ribosome stability and mRNA decay